MVIKMARYSDYKEEHCQQVLDCGIRGLHVYEMCLEMRCSQSTLYRWAEAHDEFGEAFKCARDWAKGHLIARMSELDDNKNAQPKLLEAKATFMTDYVKINGFAEENDPIKQIELLIKAVDRGERSAKCAEMMCNAIEKRINASEKLELEPLLKKLEAAIEAQK